MSMPDHEVLIGTMQQKWKQVGHGIYRSLFAAVAINLRCARVASDAKFARNDMLAPVQAVNSVAQSTSIGPFTPSNEYDEDPFESLPRKAARCTPANDRRKSTIVLDSEDSDESDLIVVRSRNHISDSATAPSQSWLSQTAGGSRRKTANTSAAKQSTQTSKTVSLSGSFRENLQALFDEETISETSTEDQSNKTSVTTTSTGDPKPPSVHRGRQASYRLLCWPSSSDGPNA